MFCTPGLIFVGNRGVSSLFHVLHSRTDFRRYQGRQVPVSCFALLDSFSAEPRLSGPVFMFCAPRLIFDGTEGVGSRFNVLRARTGFRRYRGRLVLFFMFCAPGLVFGGTEDVRSRFHVSRSRTCFWPYRGRHVSFSCFSLLDSFSAISRALGPVFMFCAPGLVFSGTGGVGSLFHVLSARTGFRRYRGRRAPFSCIPLPDSFSMVPWASGPVFMFCAPGFVFGSTGGVGSRFHVLSARTRFRRYRGRRVPFSCFAQADSFSMVQRASGSVFMFCAPGLVFGGTRGVGSLFHVLRTRTYFQWYRGRQVLFSCLALPDSFSALTRASGPVFMFFAAGLIFGSTHGVRYCFHILRSRTSFRRYRGRRVPFSCFVRPDRFSEVPGA
jgi:hypothetical protein